MRFEQIAQEKLRAPASPARASIDEQGIDELAESIAALGLLQPLLVKPDAAGFEVIAGHRRLLATRQIKLDPVACFVVDSSSEGETIAARLHENLYRRDLTAIEEAAVYAELYETLGDVDAVARMVHRSRSIVERRLGLLSGDALVRDALHEGKISAGVAEQLNLVGSDATRHYLLEFAIKDGASVEKVRGWRKAYHDIDLSAANTGQPPDGGDAAAVNVPDPNICWLCGSSEDQHDLRVRLVHQSCERYARRQMQAQMEAGKDG